MRKYHVDLRWSNPGPAKYLIDSWERDDFMDAFYLAQEKAKVLEEGHFIEIREVESGETFTVADKTSS